MSFQNWESPRFSVSQDFYLNGVETLKYFDDSWECDPFCCIEDPEMVYWTAGLFVQTGNPVTSLRCNLKHSSESTIFLFEGQIFFRDCNNDESRYQNIPKTKIDSGDSYTIVCGNRTDVLREKRSKNGGHQLKLTVSFTYGRTLMRSTFSESRGIASHDTSLHGDLVSLLESGFCSDIKLLVGSTKIEAHKCVLGIRSQYYRAMVESGMKEAVDGVVRVEGCEADVFKEFLKYLYGGKLPPHFTNIALDLLPIADRYGVDPLKSACLAEITDGVITGKMDVCEVAVVAHRHEFTELKRSCYQYIKSHLKKVKSEKNWAAIGEAPELSLEILDFVADEIGAMKL